jgi:TonB family protein
MSDVKERPQAHTLPGYNGNGSSNGSGNGAGVLVSAPPPASARRAPSRAHPGGGRGRTAPPVASASAGRRRSPRLLLALLLGGAACASIFLLIGWIQPSLGGSERIELPRSVQVQLKDTRPKAKVAQKREEPSERQKPIERIRKAPPRQVKSTADSQARQRLAGASKSMALTGISGLGLTLPGFAAGGGLALSLPSEDAAILDQAASVNEYQRRRDEIRRGMGGRDRAGPGGIGRGMDGMKITIGEGQSANTPAPRYPEAAQQKGITGFVQLRLLVSITGDIEQFEITGSDPEGVFEQAVIDVLPSWSFPVGLDEEGRPMERWIDFKVPFVLK